MASPQGIPLECYVIVRLNTTDDLPPSHIDRQIRLTRTNNSMKIGRASKVEAKGFIAMPENGYFDSPVMSRTHAEIFADLDSKEVNIKDVDSLHGTFVNEVPLKKDLPQVLASGDTIRFGAPIYRATETYPPTVVRVDIEFRDPPKPDTVQTFRAPEVIEIDDRDDAWTDDESVQIQEESEFTARLGSDLKLPAIVDLMSPPPRDESVAEGNNSNSSICLSDESEDEDMEDGESYESSSQVSTGYANDYNESDMDENGYDDSDLNLELETEDEHCLDDDLLIANEAYDNWDNQSDISFDINQTDDSCLTTTAAIATSTQQAITETMQANLVSPKANSFNIESLLNPADSAPSVSPPDISSAVVGPAEESLGARYGKEEYFAARQHNKNKIGSSLPQEPLAVPTAPPSPEPAAVVAEIAEATTLAIPDSVIETPSQAVVGHVNTAERPLEADKPPAKEHMASSPLLEAGEKFLNSPIQEKEVDSQSSHDDEVLVSAADFMQKRMASTASTAQTKDAASLKRKADQMSEAPLGAVGTPFAPDATELRRGPAESERPAKRQMTPTAKQVSSRKSKAWAIIETAAAAAVGGGIVLAGMIMTAPTLT